MNSIEWLRFVSGSLNDVRKGLRRSGSRAPLLVLSNRLTFVNRHPLGRLCIANDNSPPVPWVLGEYWD